MANIDIRNHSKEAKAKRVRGLPANQPHEPHAEDVPPHNPCTHKVQVWDLDDSQFGFRNGCGTREAIFGLNVLL